MTSEAILAAAQVIADGISLKKAGLAQLVEHSFRKAGVRCSNHLSGTIFLKSRGSDLRKAL